MLILLLVDSWMHCEYSAVTCALSSAARAAAGEPIEARPLSDLAYGAEQRIWDRVHLVKARQPAHNTSGQHEVGVDVLSAGTHGSRTGPQRLAPSKLSSLFFDQFQLSDIVIFFNLNFIYRLICIMKKSKS